MKMNNYFFKMGSLFCFLMCSLTTFSCGGGCSGTDDLQEDTIPSSPADKDKIELDVATFNLRVQNSGDTGDKSWTLRKEHVKQIIEKYGFDIFGVQEALSNQLIDVLSLSRYAFVGVGREGGTNGEYSAVLYKKDKFYLLDSGTFWLSENTTTSNIGWDAALPRICTWGKFKDKDSGKVLFFFNTHFDHIGDIARQESAKLILSKMKSIAGDFPAFFTGDLNLTPDSDPIKFLANSKYVWDSRTIPETAPLGTEGTFHGYNLDGTTKMRIDYIFVTKSVQVKSYVTINDDIELKAFSSDHFPVMVKVKL